MPLANSVSLEQVRKTTLVRRHRVKEVVHIVSLTPTLQRQQQPAQRRASSSARRTLPKGVLETYRGGVLVR
jgi:hypothetical protein